MAASSAAELQPVAQIAARLQALLERARSVKPETDIDPPLPVADLIPDVDSLHDGLDEHYDQAHRFGITDYAARDVFYNSICSTDIDDPGFVEVWNLLDVLMLCGDRERCSPELVGYVIEELLDSQTTTGCRRVFDYLESRRERLFAKDFHKKNFTLLRACNELLRRLSRAEDAIFCGRVFFFLFQSFPLGDKSSVNLRGEFHVENTTKFEVSEQDGEKMDEAGAPNKTEDEAQVAKSETPQPPTKPGAKAVPARLAKRAPEEEIIPNSELYPIFWRLQQDFSDPTRLFVAEHFAVFKKGLMNTLTKFQKTPTVQTKIADDSKRGVKRKHGEDGVDRVAPDHFVNNYNPKYLTSRDLFDLELSDRAFQRNILVQALILIDFLLSLTEKVKKKVAAQIAAKSAQMGRQIENKSLVYNYTLSEEDTKWVNSTRSAITAYLQAQSKEDGRFYHRMVETVLARDKNWIRWKLEGCPLILRDPVSTEQQLEARSGARGATRPRRVPPQPMGAMDLSFLEEGQGGGLEALKDPARFTAPTLDDLIDGVRTDKLDLEMAMDDAEKTSLENAIANKTWRALRHVRATDLKRLHAVDPAKDLEEVFRPQVPAEGETEAESKVKVESNLEGGPVEALPVGSSGENGQDVAVAPAVTITDGDATAGTGESETQQPVNDPETSGEGTAAVT